MMGEQKEQMKSQKIKKNRSLKRTHYCGDLRPSHEGENVILMGWIDSQRDHGGVLFLSLRDRTGLVQIVCDLDSSSLKEVRSLKNESVVAFSGRVLLRPKGKRNSKLKTGDIEVKGKDYLIFSKAKDLPFQISTQPSFGADGSKNTFENLKTFESLRLKYRYLDLRSAKLQHSLFLRHKAMQCTRKFFTSENFLEIDTPILYKSTPEGAQDYLVPSRIYPGKFYALPQSPQTLKQLLMVGGMDRYFQIAKCFRDEDLRADRQPEFSQIDIEMSFVENEEDIMSLNEKFLKHLWKEVLNVDIEIPLPRFSYEEALRRFGTDRPDLRIPWEIKNISSLVQTMNCEIFKKALNLKEGRVLALKLPHFAKLSQTLLKKWVSRSKEYGASGLIWIQKKENSFLSPIAKILSQENLKDIFKEASIENDFKNEKKQKEREREKKEPSEENAIVFVVADTTKVASNFLSALRSYWAEEMKILNSSEKKGKYAFLWVKDFPLFEFDSEEEKWKACHHPFTSPKKSDLSILLNKEESRYGEIKARAYDLVCNGVEVAGGSIRNHNSKEQRALFQSLGLSETEIQEKFGFFLEALDYGTPPHGGIAWGFDRLISLLSGTNVIRDVIAFPKTRKAVDLMSGTPSHVSQNQLKVLNLHLQDDENQ